MVVLDPKKKYNYTLYVCAEIKYPRILEKLEVSNIITCLDEVNAGNILAFLLDEEIYERMEEIFNNNVAFGTFDRDKVSITLVKFVPLYCVEQQSPGFYKTKVIPFFSKVKFSVKREISLWWWNFKYLIGVEE